MSFKNVTELEFNYKNPQWREQTASANLKWYYNHDIPDYPTDKYKGRGIVISADGKYNVPAYVSIRLLRTQGCTLPIQIWTMPGKRNAAFADVVRKYNVEVIDSAKYLTKHPHSYLNGWELKIYSVIYSPFQEVLFLDADSHPLRDPEYVFEHSRFKQCKAIFSPDYTKMNKSRPFYRILDIDFISEQEWESGQFYVDKESCWKTLHLINLMNEWGVRFFWGTLNVHGDKDIFRAGFKLSGHSVFVVKQLIHRLKCTMVQHDPDGKRLFQHRNLDKWNYEKRNRTIPGYIGEAECLRYIDDLRAVWHLFTDKASKTVSLTGTRWLYRRVGHDERQITFKGSHNIDEGKAGREWYYQCDGATLSIFGVDNKLTCQLKKIDDHIYQGKWVSHEKMSIILRRL